MLHGITIVVALLGQDRDGFSSRRELSEVEVEQTRKTLEEKAGANLDAARVAGLVLGSPEFQRR